MLDVKIGSLVCFLIYTLQELPWLGGRKFKAWYSTTNHKIVFDQEVRWVTNIFWGYVGFRVLNQGLYGGVLIYLLALGIVRANSLYRKMREKRLQEAIKAFIEFLKKGLEGQTILLGTVGTFVMKWNASDGKIELEIRVNYPPKEAIGYIVQMGVSLHVSSYKEGAHIIPSKWAEPLEIEMTKALKRHLKKFEFSKVLEELTQILEAHAARQ